MELTGMISGCIDYTRILSTKDNVKKEENFIPRKVKNGEVKFYKLKRLAPPIVAALLALSPISSPQGAHSRYGRSRKFSLTYQVEEVSHDCIFFKVLISQICRIFMWDIHFSILRQNDDEENHDFGFILLGCIIFNLNGIFKIH
ncbi:uncharacterized protein DS421_14g462330 [Arachis hypogaea]|nr:uncharacterized protein DS421_14g462330 [Arachis hypogaea]